jgi:hypothetical protein
MVLSHRIMAVFGTNWPTKASLIPDDAILSLQ